MKKKIVLLLTFALVIPAISLTTFGIIRGHQTSPREASKRLLSNLEEKFGFDVQIENTIKFDDRSLMDVYILCVVKTKEFDYSGYTYCPGTSIMIDDSYVNAYVTKDDFYYKHYEKENYKVRFDVAYSPSTSIAVLLEWTL